MYLIIKHLHMACAVISILGFMVRGALAINQHKIMQRKWVRVVPHIVDSVLLAAAIYLVLMLHLNPISQPWLIAKIIALIFYIFLGTVVIKSKGNVKTQWIAYGASIIVFVYIVMVAITKSPLLGIVG